MNKNGTAVKLSFPNRGLIADIVDKENEYHWNFFGKKFNLTAFSEALADYGESKIKFWAELGLEPHFEPNVLMVEDADFPGWEERPEKSFYSAVRRERVAEIEIKGKRAFLVLKRESYTLFASPVLIDVGVFPSLNVIEKVGPGPMVRSERFIESNVFPQLYPDMLRSSLNKAAFCKEFYLNEKDNGNGRIKGRLCIGGKAGLSGVRWCRDSLFLNVRPVFVL